MPKTATKPKTTMVIKEVMTVEEGPNTGDLVISVIANRAGVEYKLPYQINRRNVDKVDIEFIKQRVTMDIDAKEAEHNKHDAVFNKLKLQIDKKIALDN